MKSIYLIAVVLSLTLGVIGCQNTAEGAKEDTRDNSIKASNSIKDGIDNGANMAKNVASDAKNAGDNLSAAASLTPRIKNAFNAEPKLNKDTNLIDVDSTKETVILSGHVASQELKSLAVSIAKAEMSKAKADQKLVDNLVVQKPTDPKP